MADILWGNVVGYKTVSQGGYFGDLLTIARAHVDDAVRTNRLTSAQAGEIYTAMIPAAMQQAMQFELSEALTEAQIADALAKTEIAQKESELNQVILSLQADKLVSDTDIAERQMLEVEATGSKQRILLDEEKDTADLNQALLTKESVLKDTQIDKVYKDIDISERQMVEAEATGGIQREVATAEVNLKEANLDAVLLELDIKQKTLDDSLLTSSKQRDVLEEEIQTANKSQILLDIDKLLKELQMEEVVKTIDIRERDMVEKEQTGVVTREVLAADRDAKEFEVTSVLPRELTKLNEEINLLIEQSNDIHTKNRLALLAQQLSTWSQSFNSGKVDNVPDILGDLELETIYDDIKRRV